MKRLVLNDAAIVRRYKAGELESRIADSLEVSAPVIHRRLLAAGVALRTHKEACRLAHGVRVDETQLLRRYEAEKESANSIAVSLGVSGNLIRRRLADVGVRLRNSKAAHDLICHATFSVTEAVLEVVDGLLLGDAWLEVNGSSEGRLGLAQRADRLSWLEQVQAEFATMTIDSSIRPRPGRTSRIGEQTVNGKRALQLRTAKYVPFTAQRARWYPTGIKIVPSDVRLTPRSLAHWYWGDGSLSTDGRAMSFCTDGFSWNEVEYLASRLHVIYGWTPNVYKHRGRPKLSVARRKHRLELAALIRPFCPPCFEYKLNVWDRAPSKLAECEEKLRQLRAVGWTQTRISAYFKMSNGWGGWACRRLNI